MFLNWYFRSSEVTLKEILNENLNNAGRRPPSSQAARAAAGLAAVIRCTESRLPKENRPQEWCEVATPAGGRADITLYFFGKIRGYVYVQ